jgi:hypothetical protein
MGGSDKNHGNFPTVLHGNLSAQNRLGVFRNPGNDVLWQFQAGTKSRGLDLAHDTQQRSK